MSLPSNIIEMGGEVDSSDDPFIRSLAPVGGFVQDSLLAFLDATGRKMLSRVADALDEIEFPPEARFDEILGNLEGFISEVDRGIRGVSYTDALNHLAEDLQGLGRTEETKAIRIPQMHLDPDSSAGTDDVVEYGVPLRAISSHLVSMLFLLLFLLHLYNLIYT